MSTRENICTSYEALNSMSKMDIDEVLSNLDQNSLSVNDPPFPTPLPHQTPSKHKKPKSKLFPGSTDREESELNEFNKILSMSIF